MRETQIRIESLVGGTWINGGVCYLNQVWEVAKHSGIPVRAVNLNSGLVILEIH